MEVGKINKKSMFNWEININYFKDLSVKDELRSPIFFRNSSDEYNNKWQLKLYPKGATKSDKGFFSLYLTNVSSKEVTATFSLSLLNQNSHNLELYKLVENHLFKENSEENWGFSKFIEESYVMDPNNELVRYNKLTICCIITIENNKKESEVERKEKVDLAKKLNRLKFLDDFEKVMTNEEFSDVKIKVGEKNFHLHKCILVAHSDVFETMFRSDMIEKNQNIVTIEDASHEVLEEFFRFIYTGKVSDNIRGMICELLDVAEKYHVEELKQWCEEIMCKNLAIDNAVKYLYSAILFNAKKLEVDSMEFLTCHLKNFVDTPEFAQLGSKHPEVLIKIMKKQMNMEID